MQGVFDVASTLRLVTYNERVEMPFFSYPLLRFNRRDRRGSMSGECDGNAMKMVCKVEMVVSDDEAVAILATGALESWYASQFRIGGQERRVRRRTEGVNRWGFGGVGDLGLRLRF